MKFYLSSYKLGNEVDKLQKMLCKETNMFGYIPNALDYSEASSARVREHMQADISSLTELGIHVQLLDLRDFFGKENALRNKLKSLDGVWVSGGNVFVLRQAMRLSGFDTILREILVRKDFVYGGYSAAGCVLSPSLDAYQLVDNANDTPYAESKDIIWDGLGLIDFAFLPHFDSDHPESKDIAKEVVYCTKHKIPFKAIRDGEVLILET